MLTNMQDDESSNPSGAMSWNCGFCKTTKPCRDYVGDKATGKTCLIRAFTNAITKDAFLPSFDYVYAYTHWIMSGPLELRIVELRSKDDIFLMEVQSLCRQLKHVFLFVSSVDKYDSAYRLERMDGWVACVKKAMGPGVPSALVCNKIDLRSHPVYKDKSYLLLDADTVYGIRLSCGISSSFECSAETGEMVDQVFIGAAMLAYKYTHTLCIFNGNFPRHSFKSM
ncbi:hypothetical protein CEXT_189641 [Caerostris extrusa]|uniref:Uncharacterized protein n=1 Tax=Caerostris extrusa TaxID=172846 RepID=A0AAV4X2D5_CAEEX|nr:hypothetical protein CEXT_189641 [Caerostris extrusa]